MSILRRPIGRDSRHRFTFSGYRPPIRSERHTVRVERELQDPALMGVEALLLVFAPSSTSFHMLKHVQCCSDNDSGGALDMSAGVRLRRGEGESNRLIVHVQEPKILADPNGAAGGQDRLLMLRELFVKELIPAFDELKEKYAASEVILEMDASSFLGGGRGIVFQFQVGDCQTRLAGTVTYEAVAFHETTSAPDMEGELASGPMLRLHRLNARTFKEFICERLAGLLKIVLRGR